MKQLSEFINESLQKRLGRCYELSWQFVSSNSDWNLVHGYITDSNFGSGHTIDHAWCQNGKKIYDPVVGLEYTIEIHKALFNPEIEKTYTWEEMMKEASDSGHYGPWHKIDKKKIKFNKNYAKNRGK